jgi:glutamine amidotransferase
MSAPQLAVLDYGMGNLRSVEKALERTGARVRVTNDLRPAERADGLVLPGVGAFPKAMEAIRERGFDELIYDRVRAGVPVLGICLGLQLLFERSEELGGSPGLGLLEGAVEQIGTAELKLPQIGWNEVSWRYPSRLTAALPERCAFYHVHSFAPRPAREADVLGTATYGRSFASAVEREPLYGVQFHPEKSGPHGLRLLANFVGICAAEPGVRAAA